jgi:5-formyltetrahydrofolate cyclo-ligase
MDFKNEVKTIPLIKKMLYEGKNVIISYTDAKNVKLIPVELHDIENDLEKSPYGYLQPKENLIVPVEVDKFDLIIVPGVVFDRHLNRIGFGKGYYDRILEFKRKDARAIAVAYEFQLQDEIPSQEHDIKMDMIITEEKIYY